MIAVLTGDLINSRKVEVSTWLPLLKEALNTYGKTPQQWEVFRGDSFQLETPPEKSLQAALLLKSTLKQQKSLDVRIAIGLGDKTHEAEKITEANGTAFYHSGKCFDNLKKQRLSLKSDYSEFDKEFNLLFHLASLTINEWSPITAAIIKTVILNPDYDQNALAKKLDKAQSNISRDLKKGGFDEIKQLLNYYQTKVNLL